MSVSELKTREELLKLNNVLKRRDLSESENKKRWLDLSKKDLKD